MSESNLASNSIRLEQPLESAPLVVIVYKTFGPYHIARLRHAAEQARHLGIRVEGLAIAGKQTNYSWLESTNEGLGFRSTTLFPGETIECISKFRMIKKINDYIWRVKPKIVFTSHYASFPMIYLATLTRIIGGKVAIMSDSTKLDHRRYWFKEKIKRIAMLPYSGAFVSGQRAKNYIVSLGLSEHSVVCGVDVVDNQAISNHVTPMSCSEKQSILCVARLIKEKNLFNLIDAYALYRRKYASSKPLSLEICGNGPLENQLRQHAQSVGINGIDFKGFVRPPELFARVMRARTLILPSISETWGLAVNEAMAAGLPVLVSERCGCVPDLVQPGKTGWHFDPEDIEEIASLMDRVEKLSEEDYQQMAAASRDLIADWDLDRFAYGILNLTNKLSFSCDTKS